ncbi:MAG: 4-(cytidine 5'-diphospho)-2-C-methyl-D-erythritol kinase [Thiofilum sp.]|uniref:4-(cytidine 5'-diphospho)-2-C-methyl-D-erythritol kinase n=1 Tax=Thiofilum sp. TaxID=2212733 RepID=UPI0025CD9BB9|nr:4-(cytidine 5'-diphospho)-2-C-methyl-D-erythritol kinase [Thiofilum sp.]MBK8453303.1 4-(cytidine 5'-diphospho)-2-C-methyl-D-erythritol kinase [Thiofilum sp.]
MTTLILPAPAKLNLFLHITGRRSDGYHLLQTIFQLLDYGDSIQLTLRHDGVVRRVAGNESVSEHTDLMVRAAQLLKPFTPASSGVEMAINKVLPMGGGLGGGSSNAATVLVGLNQLWQCGLSTKQLAELGLKLGADVPVFVEGHTAWAEGVGEVLSPIDLPERWYLVVAPEAQVATREIFLHPDLTRNCEPIKMATFLNGATQNVFESLVRKQHSNINQVFEVLNNCAKPRLTGSGACVFAEFDTKNAATQIQQKLPKSWKTFVAKGVNQSPLVTQLKLN